MISSAEPPRLYFRVREPGAAVFRVIAESPQRRLELEMIAVASVRTGEIKPHGGGPDADETAEIADWILQRRKSRQQRDDADVRSLVEKLNYSAQWLQSRADKKVIAAFADDLLFALHDLRGVIVRRLAESDEKAEPEE